MDAAVSSLEKMFQRVEEESERRAQAEEDQGRAGYGGNSAGTSARARRDRRRGSISISRFGQPLESTKDPSGSTTRAQPRLSTIASRSFYYQSQINAGSVDSFASSASGDLDDSRIEDDQHVTQMEKIAGRQSLSKALSRRLSRARSKSTVLTGDNLVIGVSVEEATVESEGHSEASPTAAVVSGGVRPQSSRHSLGGPRSPGGNWTSKAKDFTQKFRRKSKVGLSDS